MLLLLKTDRHFCSRTSQTTASRWFTLDFDGSCSSKAKVSIYWPISFHLSHFLLFYALDSPNDASPQNRPTFLSQNIPNNSISVIYIGFWLNVAALSLRWAFLGPWVSVCSISYCFMHQTRPMLLLLETDHHFCSRTSRTTAYRLFTLQIQFLLFYASDSPNEAAS